ncbi:MAG TPA: DegV family protein [Stackebrandtia sp.]|nr:DegV family protein [Stackebrandtia sp.]HZE40313.1 DegV family protein [Stackebrandtia sp.]
MTDSTACLPPEAAQRRGVTVVPVQVAVNGVCGAEGVDVTAADIYRAFGERRVEMTTSRPAPGEFARVYRRLLREGASAVVSVHLSGKLSGTCEAASLAADEFGDRVRVVDSESAGMGLGFAVLAAAAAARRKADASQVVRRAERAARATEIYFYVDTLEFLRRGGRIGVAGALLGTALSVKPILHVDDGQVKLLDKVRTSVRALSRMEDLVLAAAHDGPVDIAVHHLQAPQRAKEFAVRLGERLEDRLRDLHISEVGAVLAAHCGPGLLGAAVHRRG